MNMGPSTPIQSGKGFFTPLNTLAITFFAVLVSLIFWVSLTDNPVKSFIQAANLSLLAPEAIVSLAMLAIVLHVSFASGATVESAAENRLTWWRLAVMGTVVAFLTLLFHLMFRYPADFSSPATGFDWLSTMVGFAPETPLFRADLFSLMIRLLLTLGTLMTLLFTRSFLEKKAELPGEFYILLLCALLGGMLLSGAVDLIMVFVCLETLSISSYILAAFLRGNVLSAEAGLKYLLYGGMATAILLFGLSILYGLVGSTSFSAFGMLPAYLPPNGQWILSMMTVMIVGGIAFKLSAAPFHMWAPDVYEGAPTPVVAFLSVVSKIAAFALALRLFTTLFVQMPGWSGLLSVLAVTSMVIGNVVALTQRNIKRLLAYSTVAHVGYLLLGLVVLTPQGLAGVLYYLVTYLFMNLGAFAVVTYFEHVTGRDDIAAYAGLVRKRPFLALVFSIMLLSLAGIPITAGFFGKFFLFQAVATAGDQYLWLVVVALLTSTVSLYYYLNVMRLMIIAEPSDAVAALPDSETPELAAGLRPALITMLLSLFGTLLLGITARPFWALSEMAVSQMERPLPVAAQTIPAAEQVKLPVVSRALPKMGAR